MDDFVLFDDRRTQGADDSATTASAPTSAPAKEQEIPVVDIDDVEEKPAKQKPENTDVITDDDIPF